MAPSSPFAIEVAPGETTTGLWYAGRRPPPATLVLAHGAGAGQHSPFMTAFAAALAGLGPDVVTFNFLYAERRRRLPDPASRLEACYRAAIAEVRRRVAGAGGRLFVGGKSMGGRIATQVVAVGGVEVSGLVLLGYPLHPPGRPERRRDAHLPRVETPMLFVQGSRDAFGTPAELAPIVDALRPPPTLYVVDGGDHSFKVSKKNGPSEQAEVYARIQRVVAHWIESQD